MSGWRGLVGLWLWQNWLMGSAEMTETAVEEMSFEAAMAELEKVLGQLERGDVALDESIALV